MKNEVFNIDLRYVAQRKNDKCYSWAEAFEDVFVEWTQHVPAEYVEAVESISPIDL